MNIHTRGKQLTFKQTKQKAIKLAISTGAPSPFLVSKVKQNQQAMPLLWKQNQHFECFASQKNNKKHTWNYKTLKIKIKHITST
jgi:hypothetical protein